MHRYAKALHHWPTLLSYARKGQGAESPRDALVKSAAWLLRAQEVTGNGGYAHSYHLLYGWQPAYPETTGYIIPTLLQAANVLNEDVLRHSARKAFDWLKQTQNADGSWSDLSGKAQVFDTGQILIGLNYIAEHQPVWPGAHDALRRAALWLLGVQEEDGSFIRHAYNNRPHTYYSRVGAAMMKAGTLLNDDTIKQAGLRNIDWVLSQQDPVGFFDNASFDDNPPFLHTLVYILEGLLDAHALTGRQDILDAVLYNAGHFLNSKTDDDLLRSQYHSDFTIANPHICTTGLAQWAGVCFTLAKLMNDPRYHGEGEQSLRHVKQHQIISKNNNINGALPGSIPIAGNYLRMAFPNWGMKFYMDSLMAGPAQLRRKVMFVLPALEAGGAERVLINLMNRLDPASFIASLLAVRGGPLRKIVGKTIPVLDLNRRSLLLAMPQLFRTLRRHKPDIVVSTMAHMNFALLALRPFFPKIKFIVREAITPSFFLEQGGVRAHIIRAFYKILYPLSHAIIAPARMILHELQDIHPRFKNLIWLPNPVREQDLRSHPLVNDTQPGLRFVAAGRLHHQKGFDRLITGLGAFNPPYPWSLVILGEGPERAALESRVAETGLQGHVTLAGHADIPWGYYGVADAFILPSRWEGLPNVVLEALACGTPVLALSDAGGVGEIAALSSGNVRIFKDMAEITEAMGTIAPAGKKMMAASLLPPEFHSESVDTVFADLLKKI